MSYEAKMVAMADFVSDIELDKENEFEHRCMECEEVRNLEECIKILIHNMSSSELNKILERLEWEQLHNVFPSDSKGEVIAEIEAELKRRSGK